MIPLELTPLVSKSVRTRFAFACAWRGVDLAWRCGDTPEPPIKFDCGPTESVLLSEVDQCIGFTLRWSICSAAEELFLIELLNAGLAAEATAIKKAEIESAKKLGWLE